MLILLVPALLLLLFALGIYCLVRRRWCTGIALLIAAITVNIWTETFACNIGYLFGSTYSKVNEIGTVPDTTSVPIHLRLLSYNIGLHNTYFDEQSDSLAAFFAFIDEQDADLVVLPESRVWGKERLRRGLEQRYAYCIASFFPHKEKYIETFIYSRYPIAGVRKFEHRYIYQADILLPHLDTPIRLIGCHLSSNQSHSSLRGGEGIWHNLQSGIANRELEANLICDSLLYTTTDVLSHLDEQSDVPTLIAGDLNDLSGSSTLRTLQQRLSLQDAWWQGGLGYGFTFVGKGLFLRLDHILYSRHFTLENISIPHVVFSDHYPLVATLSYTSGE